MDLNKIFKYFGWLMIFEVMIGGAGRLFDFNGITLRMILFVIAIFIQIIVSTRPKYKVNPTIAFYMLIYISLTLLSTILGYFNESKVEFIKENILMSSYFLIFPFFYYLITKKEDVDKVINLFRISSLLMASLYLLFIGLVFFRFLAISEVYQLIDNPEIAFRGTDFAIFYKGFIFMCCGFFFFLTSKNIKHLYLAILIILPAIFATLTRGFIISIVSTYFIYFLFKKKSFSILIIMVTIFVFSFAKNFYEESLGDRTDSDQMRYIQVDQVFNKITFTSFFFGHGFGSGVEIRDNHFEVNYIEIFLKQGLLGLMFWISLFLIIIKKYIKVINNNNNNIHYANPFLFSVIFLYIQSASNPFLSNSMGLTILFLSFTCLNVLSKKNILNVS
jgi:hypothetical protein